VSTGTLFIISAPSGAGKTSLVEALMGCMPGLRVSVSHTTRPMRPGEEHGVHYFFVDADEFEAMVRTGRFLEHARVFDHRYGTARTAVEAQLAEGHDVVLEIDWQGAAQVRRSIPQSVSIFILPPSREALEERLRARDQDSERAIRQRLQGAVSEIQHYREFDYLVVNDDFNESLSALRSIVLAERHRRRVQLERHAELIRRLLE